MPIRVSTRRVFSAAGGVHADTGLGEIFLSLAECEMCGSVKEMNGDLRREQVAEQAGLLTLTCFTHFNL